MVCSIGYHGDIYLLSGGGTLCAVILLHDWIETDSDYTNTDYTEVITTEATTKSLLKVQIMFTVELDCSTYTHH